MENQSIDYEKCNKGMDNGCTMSTPRPLCDHNNLITLITMTVVTLWVRTISTQWPIV